ncbi:MAG: glycosyltransferase family 39 protein [Candidatus Shapirobacteria bacterium]|jgi:4-amino-4-deoxy-L-arabinose transferase-like glycosyltransferase
MWLEKKSLKDKVFLLAILGLCYLTFFHHLDEFTIRLWDEGRNAVSALEMIKNGNPIVTYFNGIPDTWNTKPPLQIWIVAIMYKIFGVNELALRLPSAIAASLVVILIFGFGLKILKNRWIGLLGALIILSSMGFPDIHIGRTGDYDALLVLFISLGSLSFFGYLENKANKWMYFSGLFFVLAVLTKGVAGLLICPGIVLYVLFSGNLIWLAKKKGFWETVLLALLVIGSYYLGREALNQGYLAEVWREEVWNRSQNNLGANSSDFWYYWKLLASFRFQKWIYFVPLSIVAVLLTKNKVIKRFVVFAFLITVSYFLIISKTETKQMWYDAQLYPFMSLLVAIFIIEMINRVPLLLRLAPILIVCFYMQRYIRTNIAYINRPDLEKSEACLKYGYLFRDKSINKSGFVGVHKASWCNPIYFYLEREGLKRKEISQLTVGDKALTCDSITFNEIKERYEIGMIFDNRDGCLGFEIRGIK